MAGLVVDVRTNAGQVAMEFTLAAQEMRQQAMVRALNKTAEQAKVAASREIRAVGYNLKAADIKAALRVSRASGGNLRSAVIARGRPIPLIKYDARQTSKGVSVKVLKGRKVIAESFIATMPNGHRGVFVREPNAKHRKVTRGGKASWHALNIRELFGPGMADALNNEQVRDRVRALIDEKFARILEHEHAWLKRKLKPGAV